MESLVLDRTAPPLVSVVKPKLRLGLLLDSTRVSKYVLQFVQWTQTQDGLEITYLLLHPPKQNPEPFGLADFVQPLKGSRRDSTLAKLLFRFIIGLENTGKDGGITPCGAASRSCDNATASLS